MEWVETTGRTLEEAKEAALDQLGVDEQDAEFEVLEEARSGLFGRLRTEARVRARVRPTTPRPKVERRDRRRRGGERTGADAGTESTNGDDAEAPPERVEKAEKAEKAEKKAPARASRAARPSQDKGDTVEDAPDAATVAAELRSFLEGLVDAFDLEGKVSVATLEDDVVEAKVDGDDLGLLIGPKGATLTAVQELARSAVSHSAATRLRIDIGGYRERRREALERFTQSVAEQVLASGQPTSLEPMGAADRKVVHDTANTIDGVRTVSEGEDPRRRVVILPDGD